MGALEQDVQALVNRAVEAGLPRAWQLAELTPRQIELELRAYAARRQRESEQLDLLAWLVGRYVMTALHAPRRYPRRPDGILRPLRPMQDAEIKRVFLNLADQRRDDFGHR